MGFVLAAAAVIVGLLVLVVVRRRGTEDGDQSIDGAGRSVSNASDHHRPETDHHSGPGNYGF
jgi:hypothetical protein